MMQKLQSLHLNILIFLGGRKSFTKIYLLYRIIEVAKAKRAIPHAPTPGQYLGQKRGFKRHHHSYHRSHRQSHRRSHSSQRSRSSHRERDRKHRRSHSRSPRYSPYRKYI